MGGGKAWEVPSLPTPGRLLDFNQRGEVHLLAPSLSKLRPLGVKEFELFDLPFLFKNRGAFNDPDEPFDPSWDRNRALILEAERLGFDSTLVAQHTINPHRAETDVLEAWTASAALAALTERIAKRFADQGRPDDNPETFKDRLAVYNKQTAPLLPYYEAQGKLTEVDGMGDIASVAKAIDGALA